VLALRSTHRGRSEFALGSRHEVVTGRKARATSRKANAGRVSLLCSNAERTDGEWIRSRSCETVAASVVGRTFCHTRPCASLRASTIMRSELTKKTTRPKLRCSRVVGDCARRRKRNPRPGWFRRGCLNGVPKSFGGPGGLGRFSARGFL
jgi:hypothetical protein